MRASLLNMLVLALVLMVHVSTATSASMQDSFVASAGDVQGQADSPHEVRLLKRSLREALEQHFQLLQEAEQDIVTRIEALKAKRQAISERKRSHYMCLVNLIACYRK